jgi:hypothetical protein
MPFYLYGTPQQLHIEHVILASPNIQLSSDRIILELDNHLLPPIDTSPLIVHFQNTPEIALQPFPNNQRIAVDQGFFFQPGNKFDVVVSKDIEGEEQVAKGVLSLGDTTFVDVDMLNMDVRSLPSPSDADYVFVDGEWRQILA